MKIPLDPQTRVQAIANSLADLLEDPGLPALLPRLRAIAVERFDWDIRAREMERAYERLSACESGRLA
jgi:glycosyltransferase involved in cell wall biosynthesis